LPLSYEVVQKGGFGPQFAWGGDTPYFGRAFSNCTYFPACDQFSLSSVERARRLGGKKKKEDKAESVVKHKSADMYVGRPNNHWMYNRWTFLHFLRLTVP